MIWANLIGSLTLAGFCAAQEPPPAPPAARPKVTVGRPAPKPAQDPAKQESTEARDAKEKAPAQTPVRTVRGPGGKAGVRVHSKFVDDLVIPKARPREESTPSYRVSIRLPGGRRFTGVVVRDPSFHRTVFAGQHHRPEAYLSSRSFKLSFVDGLDGEVELRWNQMARVEVRDVVSDQDVLAMQRASELARMKRDKQARAQRTGEEPAAEGADPSEVVAGSEPEPPAAEEQDRPEILRRFPPEDGWSAERKRQIEWRRTVVGTFPTEEEQAFLEAFDEWEPAAKAWTAEQVQRMEAERLELERKKKQVEQLEKQVLRDDAGRPAPGGARPTGDG